MSETLSYQHENTLAVLHRHNSALCFDPCGLRDEDEARYIREREEEILEELDLHEAGRRVAIYIDPEQLPQLAAVYGDTPLRGTITNITFEQNYTMADELAEGLTLIIEPEAAEDERMSFPLPLNGIRTMEDVLQ